MPTNEEWNQLADQVIAASQGDDPLTVLCRASWEHSKMVNPPFPPDASAEWLREITRAEISYMLAALVAAGYSITPTGDVGK